MTRYNDCLREHVRLFLSTDVIIRSSNVTPVDDYEQRYNILFVRLPLNLANRNNVGIPMHKNMSLSRFKSSIDSCAAIIQNGFYLDTTSSFPFPLAINISMDRKWWKFRSNKNVVVHAT